MKPTLKSPHNLRRNAGESVQLNVKTASRSGRFICPECGSDDFIAIDPAEGRLPKSLVRRTVICGKCYFEIPLHLGERWGGLSLTEAKKEWREVYRRDGISQKGRARTCWHLGSPSPRSAQRSKAMVSAEGNDAKSGDDPIRKGRI